MRIQQQFRCPVCDRVDDYDYGAEPRHCGAAMKPGDFRFPAGDVRTRRLHVIKLLQDPEVAWQLEGKPEHVLEFWQLAPGRLNGERIGWIGVRHTCVEWHMVPGVSISHGTAPTINDAAQAMLAAIQGGIGAKQLVAEVCS